LKAFYIIYGATLTGVCLWAFWLRPSAGYFPYKHCTKSALTRQWFQGAWWSSVTYARPNGKRCAYITKRDSWWTPGYVLTVDGDWINHARGFELDEAERLVETKYCILEEK
jgi:hypothetical protein